MAEMKVLLIAKHPRTGGAAIASSRLLEALRKEGVEAKMLVQEGADEAGGIYSTTHGTFKRWLNFLRFVVERLVFLPRERSRNIRFLFSLANTGESISQNTLVRDADILHLHWINAGFLSLDSLKELLRSGKPVVWTFHDMWPFTGGCHYALECTEYMRSCGQCPYLKIPGAIDLSHRIWKRKEPLFRPWKLTVITPSEWLNKCVRSSSLLQHSQIHTIHNPVDDSVFRPVGREEACASLGLDPGKKYILFGAATVKNVMKGYSYFMEAIEYLAGKVDKDQVEIILFGKTSGGEGDSIPLNTLNIAFVQSVDTLVQLYSAAHLFVIPSLQDNLPNTIIESMLCATPVVGFRTGGIPEMIEHKVNGYLADYKSSADLADGMHWILASGAYDKWSGETREIALKRFSRKESVKAHINLYKSMVDKSSLK
jgi:glycosyltransferase involved in cell wall biosynthesis